MKANVITCFESNEERVFFVVEALKKLNYDIKVYTSDFSHIKKQYRNNIPEHFIPIHTLSYKKNLSISRLLSHFVFARDVFKMVENDIPDLIWLMIPANSLAKTANEFKKNHPNVKIICDVIDMWPESLPFAINKNIFPLNIWKNIRSNNLKLFDKLVCECDFYKNTLSKEFPNEIDTLYWARENNYIVNIDNVNSDKISLAYVGSINNIIDSNAIANMIKNIDSDVDVHVIGEGESTDEFISTLSRVSNVLYYGPIRDQVKKSEIFSKCHAGINMYKKGLYIGLTTKCIDYFENGLPIINNIKGDTWKMIEDYGVGFNVNEGYSVISSKDIVEKRFNNENVYELYNTFFTKKVFIDKCMKIIKEVKQ